MTARDRAIEAIAKRLANTQEAEQLRRAIQQPAQYDGAGRIRALGAAGGVPVRDRTGEGGLAIGQPVAASQGILSFPPNFATKESVSEAVAQVLAQLGTVASRRGIRTFIGDPNDSGNPAFQEFDYQILYGDDGTLYYWNPGTSTVVGSWVPFSQLLIEATTPTVSGRLNGALHLQLPASGSPTLRTWRSSTTEWLEISGGGGSNTIFSTNPPPNPVTGSPSDGDRWVDTTIDRAWTYDATQDEYLPDGSKNFYDENPLSTTTADALAKGDVMTIQYLITGNTTLTPCSWMWDGSDWKKFSCCSDCPDEPLPAGTTCGPGTVPGYNPDNGVDQCTGYTPP